MFAAVFPTGCSLCGQELAGAGLTGICRDCWRSLEPWIGPCCARCGLPFPAGQALDSVAALCGECRKDEYEFDLSRSFGVYTGYLRAAILQLKFHRRERLGRRLGELLAGIWESVRETAGSDDVVLLPVPLHRSREQERGFNQAELLARGLSGRVGRRFGVSRPAVEVRCLRRIRATLPQTGLSPQARRENVQGVFEVVSPEPVRGRVAVLVDDVMTTGFTLSACAGALKRAGALRVLALTLARATPQFPDEVSIVPSLPVDEPRFERP